MGIEETRTSSRQLENSVRLIDEALKLGAKPEDVLPTLDRLAGVITGMGRSLSQASFDDCNVTSSTKGYDPTLETHNVVLLPPQEDIQNYEPEKRRTYFFRDRLVRYCDGLGFIVMIGTISIGILGLAKVVVDNSYEVSRNYAFYEQIGEDCKRLYSDFLIRADTNRNRVLELEEIGEARFALGEKKPCFSFLGSNTGYVSSPDALIENCLSYSLEERRDQLKMGIQYYNNSGEN